MSQDTRKDPRAKIVSLNVRYKSATVDEFIDNHAMDVSKGGIFIKTSTPFPQGTLLKFEIRLAGDQSVIAGVGRVVWKREPGAAGTGPDRAAGMGVKFIKLDDASRQVIDKLAASRPDSGSAFTSELENDVTQVDQKAPAGMTGAAALKSTIAGVGPSAKPTLQGMPAQTAPRPAAGIKSTIVGMPAVQQPKDDPKPAAASGSGSSGGFFPAGSGSEADMPPPAERTVMKQAAELLEEALKEAGGSMDEVGSNPLFEKPAAAAALPAPTKEELEDAPTEANEMPKAAPPKEKAAPTETASLPKPITQQPILASDRAHSLSSSRPAAVSAKSFVAEPEERKPSLLPFALLGLVVIGAGGFGLYKAGVFGGSAPVDTTTPPIPTPSVTMSAPPMDSAMPMTDASLAAIPETADGGGLAAAMAAKDAGAPMPSVTATVKPPATVYHPPKPKPTATATDEPSDTSAPTATTTATPPTTTTTTPAPTDTPTLPTPTAAPTTTSTAAPTATTKPTSSAKPADDNPY